MTTLPTSHPLRRAEWIWPAGCGDMRNTFAQFRRDFMLKSVPRRTPLFITADQGYQCWINGHYAGRGPARGFQSSWAYDELDVSHLLKPGHNRVSVLVFNGGRSTFGYCFEWYAGLLCALRLGQRVLGSDADWVARVSPAYRPDTPRMSVQTNLQEQFDARLDDGAWIRLARRPSGWPAPDTRAFGSQPWYALEPRGIPMLTATPRPYARAVAAAEGRCAAGWKDAPDAVVPLKAEFERLSWQQGPPHLQRSGDWSVLDIPATGRNRVVIVVLDMGEPTIGTLLVDAAGATGDEILDFHGSEALTDDGVPLLPGDVGKPPRVSFAWRLALQSGRTRHEFYQLIGHRYLAVAVRNTTRALRLKLAVRETRYPLDIRGRFACSDGTLNDIRRICVRTQQVCMLDAYVDTPWREQAQWWGDARVQAGNTFHLAADARLLERGVRIISRQRVPNGLTYGHAPTNSHGCVLPDFAMIWALTLWDHYWQTGETDLVAEQWPGVKQLLGYFDGEGLGSNGLLHHDKRYWLFLDWTNIHKKGTPTLLNLWYSLMLDRLTELAKLTNRTVDARALAKRRREHDRRMKKLLWDGDRRLYRDGLTPGGRPVQMHSVHNQTLAILAGLQSGHWNVMLRERILPYLRDETVPGARPSSYWVGYVYGVAVRHGYGAEAVRHIRRHYAPMIPGGGTREVWNGGSYTHAWAAHPIQHLAAALGGVRQTAPAWRTIEFSPVMALPEVDHAEVAIPAPLGGEIATRWQRDEHGVVDIDLRLPRGTKADIQLAGVKQDGVSGRWQARVDTA